MSDDSVRISTSGVTAADQAGEPTAVSLRCQWCMTAIPSGVTTCPTCGSSAIPDPRMVVPGAEPVTEQAIPVVADPGPAGEPTEWWREEDQDGVFSTRRQPTFEEVEQRRTQTLLFIGGSIVVCVVIGWLLGPLLAPALESLTGTPVEDPNDLRPTGMFFGLLAGFFVGALAGLVIWSGR
jgi:hypothetical protein